MHNNLGFVQKVINKKIKAETFSNCIIFEKITDRIVRYEYTR